MRNKHFGIYSSLPSLLNLLEANILYTQNKLIFINKAILDAKLIYLGKNFPSNFYRLLYDKGEMASVKDLLRDMVNLKVFNSPFMILTVL